MLNLTEVQDEILTTFRAAIPQQVYEQGIPDADTVKKIDGQVVPYIALQFGDLQDRLSGRSFSGARGNDYELPIYVQVIAPVPEIARKIASGNVLDSLLGLQTKWTGEVRKRPGGGMWPITSSNGATEAYMVPSSWAVTVQLYEL